MKKMGVVLIAAAMVLSASLSGCSSSGDGATDVSADGSNDEQINQPETKTVTSSDGSVSIEIPNDWTVLDDEDESVRIYTANKDKGQYIMITTSNGTDLADGDILDEYFSVTQEGFNDEYPDAVWGTPEHITIDGRDTILCQCACTVENIKLVYWFDFTRAGDYMYYIAGWTVKSKADEYKDLIIGVIKTFKVLQ